ncbi:unnamed protein product, partial [Trichobilharzia regenti]
MLYVQFPLRVIITIEGFIGAILNSLSLFVVFKTRFGSRSTTLMLRLQPIFDMSACFLYAMYTATENGRPTKILFIDKILCYLWSNNIAFWLGVVLSVHNIMKKRQRRSTKSLSVAEISHIDGLQQHVDHASNENK